MNVSEQIAAIFAPNKNGVQASADGANTTLHAAAFVSAVLHLNNELKPNSVSASLRAKADELYALAALVEAAEKEMAQNDEKKEEEEDAEQEPAKGE